MEEEARPDPIARLFAARGRHRRFVPGEVVLRRGSTSRSVLWIVDGLVKVAVSSPSGRGSLLEIRGPGSLLGEMSVLLERPHSADVVAVGEVTARSLTSAAFSAALDDDGAVCRAVLTLTAERLDGASTHQHRLASAEALPRLCAVLIDLADRHGRATAEGTVLADGFNQQDLAELAGMSRDQVVRCLRALRDAGAVVTGRQRIVIRDRATMERLRAV